MECLMFLVLCPFALGYSVRERFNCPLKTYGHGCTPCKCEWSNTKNCTEDTGKCQCKEGFTGQSCDRDFDECIISDRICQENRCVNTYGHYQCRCQMGFTNTSRGICQPCSDGKYGLDCKQQCGCHKENALYCSHLDGECVCRTGWESKDCSLSVDDCKDNDCPLDTCEDRHQGYECVCGDRYMLVQGICEEYSVDLISLNTEPAIGEFVDIYLFFSLPDLYFKAPPLAPNIKFKVTDDKSKEECWTDLKLQARRLEGNEPILQEIKMDRNSPYEVYCSFRKRFMTPGLITVTAESLSLHRKLRLVFDVKYKSKRVENCLYNISIPDTEQFNVSLADKFTYSRQRFLMFELHIPPSTACFESPRVIWDFFLVKPPKNFSICLNSDAFTKLDIDVLTKKSGELLMSDHHQHKEIITKNTLPLGTVAFRVTAYIQRSISTKVITYGFIKIIPAWIVIGKMWPGGSVMSADENTNFLVQGDKYKEPDRNTKLRYNWICRKPVDLCSNIDYYEKRVWLYLSVPYLKAGNTYDFELQISIKGHSNYIYSRKFKLVVGNSTTTLPTKLFCLQSCSTYVNVKKIMVLRVTSFAFGYNWTLTEEKTENSGPAVTYHGKALKPFRVIKWHKSFFFSRLNVYKPGHRYTIKCTTSDYSGKGPKGHAEYFFFTEDLPKGNGCNISPLYGKAVFTKFTVKCKDYKDETSGLPLIYKLYQGVKDTETGKMLNELVAYSNDGTFHNVTLSSELRNAEVKLLVEISTANEMSSFQNLSVKLSTDDQNEILLKTADMRKTLGKVGSQEDLRLVKDVATVMKDSSTASKDKKQKIRKQLFNDMKDFEAIAGDSIEHSSTALTELAARNDEVDDDGLTDGLAAAERITKYLGKCGGGNIVLIKGVADVQMSAMDNLLKVSSEFGKEIYKRNMTQVEKDDRFERGREHSRRTMNSMTQIVTTLRGGFDVSSDPIRIKKDTMEVLLEKRNIKDKKTVKMNINNNNVGFSVPSKNVNILGNGSVESEFQVYDKSPYSFRSNQVHGDMPVVKVKFVEPHLENSAKQKRVTKRNWQFSKPADIFLKNKNISNETIEYPTLLFVNKYTDEVYMSDCIYLSVKASTVETTALEVINGDNLTLKAKSRYTNSISALELLTDYDMIDFPFPLPDKGFNINVGTKKLSRSRNFLFLPRLTKKQINSGIPYYHIKINVKKGQKLTSGFDKKTNAPSMPLEEIVAKNNLTIDAEGLVLYNITISVIPHKLSCVHFDEKKMDYSYDSCELSVFTTKEELHCRCVVAAAFSASYIIVPRLINPLDIESFLEIFDNPLSVSMVIGLWMIFLALFVWGRRKDNEDEIRRGATVLEDNREDDSYVYLLCIVTGNSALARTTSNVYIFLKGTWGKSDIHVLNDNSRALFQSGAENWFVLTTESDLGYLKSAVVWIDYSGGNPSWYLYNIYVQNVQTGEAWNLSYNSWLSGIKGSKQIIAEIPATEESPYTTSWLSKVTGKGKVDLRNDHLWFGMVYKTAHNKFTRYRRLATALSMLQSLMLLNLVFYDIKDLDDSRQFLEIFGKRIHLTSIIISIESCAIMSLFGMGLAFTFNRIIPRKSPVVEKSTKKKDKKEVNQHKEVDQNTNRHNEKIDYIQTFVRNDVTGKDAALLMEKLQESPREKEDEAPASNLWFTLPWWFIYIYWGFLIVFNGFVSYYIMLYGLELGYEKSLNWAVSFFSGFIFNVVIVQPFKVVAMVLFLVIVFKQTYSLKEQAPFTNLGEVSKAVERQKQRHTSYTETKVSHVYYMPPNKTQIKEILNRLAIEFAAREMLRDLLLYIVFISAVLVMTYHHSDITKAFYQTKALDRILFKTATEDGETTSVLDEISTVEDIWEFFDSGLVPFLISEAHENLDVSSFFFMGIARIRQVRVEPDESGCDDIPFGMVEVYKKEFCSFSLADGKEERRDFNRSWDEPFTFIDKGDEDDDNKDDDDDDDDDNDNSPYIHRSASELNTASIVAPRSTYPGGGYVLTLPRHDMTEALGIVKKLSNSSWIDHLTRCMFVEFTIYNPDANHFTNVVIGFEFDNSGGPFPFKFVSSSRLYHYEKSRMQWTQISEVIIAVCAAFYTVLAMKDMQRLGIWPFFVNFWNLVDITILILLYLTALFIYLRNAMMVSVLSDFAIYGNNRFLDFQAVFYRDYALLIVEGLLGGATFLKLIYVSRFNPFFKTFLKSISVAKVDVFGYTVMTVLYMFGFAMVGMLVFGRTINQYYSFGRSLLSLLFFLLGEGDYSDLVATNRIMGPAYFLVVLFVTQYIIINFFIAMVRDGLDMARSMDFDKKDATVRYMLDTLKIYLGISSNRKKNVLDLYNEKS